MIETKSVISELRNEIIAIERIRQKYVTHLYNFERSFTDTAEKEAPLETFNRINNGLGGTK